MRKNHLYEDFTALTVVVATAILVVASSVIANHFLGKSTRTIDPRVTMESGRSAGEQALKETELAAKSSSRR